MVLDVIRSMCNMNTHYTPRRVNSEAYHFHPIRNSIITARTMVINTPATNPPTTPPPTPAELAEDDADWPQSLDLAASSS